MPPRLRSRAAGLLLAWRCVRGLSQQHASIELDVQQSRLSQYELGRRVPSLKTAARIEKRTGGAVRCADWFEVEAGDVRATSLEATG